MVYTDHSIEINAEKINNPKTKNYFSEVFKSYQLGNYRSAVVMLWTVIICDLIFKLQDLRDIENDKIANSILETIIQKQESSPYNSDWENQLLELVRDRTNLLDLHEFNNLKNLQQNRHYSAHPILTTDDILFTPTREQVRAFIRLSLDSVLTKPPVFLNNVIENFLIDIESKKEILLGENLKGYIESKYLSKTHPAIETKLFRSLWKFVFRSNGRRENDNRKINYESLVILFQRRQTDLELIIQSNSSYYSDLGIENNESNIRFLANFLIKFPKVYSILDKSAQLLLQDFSTKHLNNFSVSLFLSPSIMTHLEKIKNKIDSAEFSTYIEADKYIEEKHWKILSNNATTLEELRMLREIAISLYIKTGNYNTADYSFSNYIEPLLNEFEDDELLKLLEGVEGNRQAHDRNASTKDHKLLREVCETKLGWVFSAEDYPNCFR